MAVAPILFTTMLVAIIMNAITMAFIRQLYGCFHSIPTDKLTANIEALRFAENNTPLLYVIARITAHVGILAGIGLIPIFFFELYNLIF